MAKNTAYPCCPTDSIGPAPLLGGGNGGKKHLGSGLHAYVVGDMDAKSAVVVFHDLYGWESGRTQAICDGACDAYYDVCRCFQFCPSHCALTFRLSLSHRPTEFAVKGKGRLVILPDLFHGNQPGKRWWDMCCGGAIGAFRVLLSFKWPVIQDDVQAVLKFAAGEPHSSSAESESPAASEELRCCLKELIVCSCVRARERCSPLASPDMAALA